MSLAVWFATTPAAGGEGRADVSGVPSLSCTTTRRAVSRIPLPVSLTAAVAAALRGALDRAEVAYDAGGSRLRPARHRI